MRSTRFAAAFALVLASGLAAGAFANPPMPYAPPLEEAEEQAAPTEAKPEIQEATPRAEMKRAMRRKAAARAFQNRLEKFDADGDGRLSLRERAAAREEFKSNRAELAKTIDTDGDGLVSEQEWTAFSDTLGEREEDQFFRRREVFEQFDEDRSGALEADERTRAVRELHERRIDFVMQFDENADGVISDSEKAVAKNFVERRREFFLAKYDLDKSGDLDREERRKVVTAWANDR